MATTRSDVGPGHVSVGEVSVVRSRRPRQGFGALVGMTIVAAFVLAMLTPFAALWHVNDVARIDDRRPTDAIVVLGAAQFDGTPSPVFQSRLEHAKSLFDQGVAPRVITVGGKQPGDRFTEAEAGANWLVANGVPSTDVLAVTRGADTVTSLRAVANLAQREKWPDITLVSDPTHMARAQEIAGSLGFDARTSPSKRGDGTTVTSEYLSRETLGYLWYALVQQWRIPRIVTPEAWGAGS